VIKLASRKALEDAKVALDLLDRAEDAQLIRIHWYSVVSLMRTSFDVLDKIDKKISNKIESEISKQWLKLNKNKDKYPLFWQFIKTERDLLQHKYKHSGELEFAPIAIISDEKAEIVYDEGNEIYLHDFFILNDGYYINQDGRDVAYEAYKWLDQEISEIEELCFKEIKQ